MCLSRHGAAEVSPGSQLAGRGGLILSSGGGKCLSRAQLERTDLWLQTEILLVFSRLAECVQLRVKAQVRVPVSFVFPTKLNIRIRIIPSS